MIIGAVLLTVAVAGWLYFLWSRRRFYLCALKLKGPWGLPLIGIVHKVYKLEDILYVLSNYAKEYKTKTYFSWFGPSPAIYTIDPTVADIVLQSPDCLNKAYVYDMLTSAFGSGLITSRFPEWSKHRKLLSPCFGYKVLLRQFPQFNNFARQFCQKMNSFVGCGEVDVMELTLEMGLKASIAISMGQTLDEKANSVVLNSFESLLGLVVKRILQPWYYSDTTYKWSSTYKSFKTAKTCITDFIQDLIRTKAEILENKSNAITKPEETEDVSHIFIDQAIRIHQQNEFTAKEVMGETSTMIFAAFETSANALYNTLMLLAMNPHIQERVFDEISTVFEEKDLDVTYDHFKSLVYLEMCINETLRLAPSIPLIIRRCGKDILIGKDIVLPAGCEVFIDIFNMHRDEDIWGPNALNFDPDHFLPSNLEEKQKRTFMPFSKGKRKCLGWQYAGMFLKVMLAQVIRKYRFTTTYRFEDLRCVENISLKYVTTPHLEVHRR